MERITWDQYYMAQSHLLALRSTCTRLMVGATIVREKRIIAGGYNGSVSGETHCMDEGCYMIDGHCVRTVHAEANALLQCAKFGVPTENAEIYVTHFPCLQCSKQIIQGGIKAVYYANDYHNHPYAIELFRNAGVTMKKVPLHDLHVDMNREEKVELVKRMLDAMDSEETDDAEKNALKEQARSLFHL